MKTTASSTPATPLLSCAMCCAASVQRTWLRPTRGRNSGLGRTRFYELYSSYLAACAQRRAAHWSPAVSGGNHRAPLPAPVAATLRKLLSASPPCSYSLAASEALRRHEFTIDPRHRPPLGFARSHLTARRAPEVAAPDPPLAGPAHRPALAIRRLSAPLVPRP